MAYIHAKGIAHLDLKTNNILLTADKRSTVIADFGISQTQQALVQNRFGTAVVASTNPVFDAGGGVEMAPMVPMSMTASAGPLALTPHYCAPERLLRKDLSFAQLLAADVYTYGTCG